MKLNYFKIQEYAEIHKLSYNKAKDLLNSLEVKMFTNE